MTAYPLRLDYAIDESTSKAREELLRLSVAVGLAVRSDVLLIRFGSLGCSNVSRMLPILEGYNRPRRKRQQRSARARAQPCAVRSRPAVVKQGWLAVTKPR